MTRTLRVADLFCGAGGMSLGLHQACEKAEVPVHLVGVNHWRRAIATHEFNIPGPKPHCAEVQKLNPLKAFPSGKADLVLAGVECTHFSRARGGAPVNDQRRSSGWEVLEWAKTLGAPEVLIENVREFTSWGPTKEGRPIKARRGETFDAFVDAFAEAGYQSDHRVLNAADYGDPQARHRLFLRFSKSDRPITWPEPSHAGNHRTAREIIDWSDLGTSIFTRKRPLAKRTIERIRVGIEKFAGPYAQPFLMLLTHGGRVRDIDLPLPTITGANRGELAVATPHVVKFYGNSNAASVDAPLSTVTAQSNHLGVATPILLPHDRFAGDGARVRSIDEPLPTLVGQSARQNHLVTPYILAHDQFTKQHGLDGLVDSIDRPMRTITATNGAQNYLLNPYIVAHYGERPGQEPRTHYIDDPLPTVTASKGAGSLVTPTFVTQDGIGLDILFRMLKPLELARGQGFPDWYQFSGNKGEVVKQIGNAVPVNLARSLCSWIIEERGLRKVAA